MSFAQGVSTGNAVEAVTVVLQQRFPISIAVPIVQYLTRKEYKMQLLQWYWSSDGNGKHLQHTCRL